MKIYVQWARSNPLDWNLMEHTEWTTQPTKSDPVGDVNTSGVAVGDSQLDGAPGWVFAINIQGVTVDTQDHFLIEEAVVNTEVGIKLTYWDDDPVWFPPGSKQAHIWTFLAPAWNSKVGKVNTRQSRIIYAEPDAYAMWNAMMPIENTTLLTWDQFVMPTTGIKHGIWLSDLKWNEHVAARTRHGWREWTV